MDRSLPDLMEIMRLGPARYFLQHESERIAIAAYKLKPGASAQRLMGALYGREIDGEPVIAIRAADNWQQYGRNADVVTPETVIVYRDPRVCGLIDLLDGTVRVRALYLKEITDALVGADLIEQ